MEAIVSDPIPCVMLQLALSLCLRAADDNLMSPSSQRRCNKNDVLLLKG
jgi:hypothetical protein